MTLAPDKELYCNVFDNILKNELACMAEGKVLAEGSLIEIKNNDQVIEAYLGTGLKNKEKSVVQ